jgi:hypothetical protein
VRDAVDILAFVRVGLRYAAILVSREAYLVFRFTLHASRLLQSRHPGLSGNQTESSGLIGELLIGDWLINQLTI